jgi:hypothetical protein
LKRSYSTHGFSGAGGGLHNPLIWGYSFLPMRGHYQKFESCVAVSLITPLHTQQQENVHVLYDGIGILGNLPIAHNSLWVLEDMFIEKKLYNLRKFYTVHMVSEV